VGLQHAPAHRQPDPRAARARVPSREHAEDPRGAVRVHPHAVVADGDHPLLAVGLGRHLHPRRVLSAELHCVGEQVLEHAAQLGRVAFHLGQRAVHPERGTGLLQLRAHLLDHLGQQPVQGDRLYLELAEARVREHGVDQLTGVAGALAKLAQDVGRRRLLAASLEQPRQQLDVRDRPAQVVSDHVGVAPQVRLHAALVRDVGQEHDQAVAELRDAQDVGAEHVAVAERRVVGDLLDPRLAGVADAHVLVEGTAAAHLRQGLEQRVAVGRRRGQARAPHHGGVAVAEGEVRDRPTLAADRP
jgi:hypothetical protein